MKKLELNQMENLEGGGPCDYGIKAIEVGLSGSGVIFAAATLFAAATPIGWVGLGIAVIGFGLSTRDC